jgi:hypothetical protein
MEANINMFHGQHRKTVASSGDWSEEQILTSNISKSA